MSFRYHVAGVVCEEGSGRPLLDLVVRAFDKDVFLDDFVGESRTDADGRFSIVFTQVEFQDAFETRPDLYLVVFDADAKRVLASTKSAIRWNADNEERYVIDVSAQALAG